MMDASSASGHYIGPFCPVFLSHPTCFMNTTHNGRSQAAGVRSTIHMGLPERP